MAMMAYGGQQPAWLQQHITDQAKQNAYTENPGLANAAWGPQGGAQAKPATFATPQGSNQWTPPPDSNNAGLAGHPNAPAASQTSFGAPPTQSSFGAQPQQQQMPSQQMDYNSILSDLYNQAKAYNPQDAINKAYNDQSQLAAQSAGLQWTGQEAAQGLLPSDANSQDLHARLIGQAMAPIASARDSALAGAQQQQFQNMSGIAGQMGTLQQNQATNSMAQAQLGLSQQQLQAQKDQAAATLGLSQSQLAATNAYQQGQLGIQQQGQALAGQQAGVQNQLAQQQLLEQQNELAWQKQQQAAALDIQHHQQTLNPSGYYGLPSQQMGINPASVPGAGGQKPVASLPGAQPGMGGGAGIASYNSPLGGNTGVDENTAAFLAWQKANNPGTPTPSPTTMTGISSAPIGVSHLLQMPSSVLLAPGNSLSGPLTTDLSQYGANGFGY